jgi:hypothetical protein
MAPLHNLFIHHVLGFESCLIKVHIIRWVKQRAKEEMNEEHFECIVRCAINHSNIKPCFTKCYEEHIESHIDAIYIQNPYSIRSGKEILTTLSLSGHFLVAKLTHSTMQRWKLYCGLFLRMLINFHIYGKDRSCVEHCFFYLNRSSY